MSLSNLFYLIPCLIDCVWTPFILALMLKQMIMFCCACGPGRAVCRKHELTQFELEMASQDLISKKQQREELATGVC